MKKMILLFAVLLTMSMQNYLRAQATDNVEFNVILEDVFEIYVSFGMEQTATFQTAADYNDGVFEGSGIVDGYSIVQMEATGSWNTTIHAPADFSDGSQTIPIQNLGVWVVEMGDHTRANGEINFTCFDIATTQLITLNPEPFIILGTNPVGNGGDVSDNEFRMNWRMGTPEIVTANTLGTMFDQMADGDFGPGTYTGEVILTMNPAP